MESDRNGIEGEAKSRQQLVTILVAGLKRFLQQDKLRNPIPQNSSATCLEIPAKTRLSVSHHVNPTVGRNTQQEHGQRPKS